MTDNNTDSVSDNRYNIQLLHYLQNKCEFNTKNKTDKANIDYSVIRENKINFISKDKWSENIMNSCFEDNLEYELEEWKNKSNNEIYEFENNLSNNKIDNSEFLENISITTSLFDLCTNNSKSSPTIFEILPEKINYKNANYTHNFYIKNLCDSIMSVYLEIEFPNSFHFLTISELLDILNINFELWISNTLINKKNIITALMNELCCGNNILENENTIQIPIYNFIKQFNSSNFGFIYIGNYVNFQFNIPESINHFKYKLIVNGLLIDMNEREKYFTNTFNFPIFQNYSFTHKITESLNKFRLFFDNQSKCFLINFNPIDKNISSDELLLSYPIITNIKLFVDDIKIIEYDSSELLDFNFFSIKIYVVPFAKEFGSWESILKLMKNEITEDNLNGINFSKYNNVVLHVELENHNNNFDIKITNISLNIIRIGQYGKLHLIYG